jgi:serine/threonine-protein kinase
MTDLLAALQRGLAGSHEVERELGRGGMARVFLARDLKHDRLVALKILDPDLAHAIGSERFLREIKVAARLQHPHILTVHDSGEIPGDGRNPALLWFSMPYVEGETLRDRLKREGQLPLADAVAIARDTADALAYAHAHGVIHRDIKPENLLLTGGHTMVADFGVALALGDEAQHLTGTGLAVGTPAYMSPEQAIGSPADARSDIYALGCVLYEMIAGEPPYAGRTPALALARAMIEPLRPLRSVRETVPQSLDDVVATALARAPADRFASAADMARSLRLDGEEGERGPRPQPRARRIGARQLAGVAGVAALVVAAVWLLARPGRNAEAVDPDLIAIAPFDLVTSDDDLDVWSEGIVDVVARYFDGAGTLRAVAPTRGVRAWTGRADRESAARFGRAVGAGHVVFGQIVGSDSVRLSATLYDVASGAPLDEHEWRGSSVGLDRLVDSLSTRFLDVLGRTRQLGARRERPFGTSNPLAIRAFLSGMRDFRRASYADASRHFLESVRQDSGFVLGRMYGAHSFGWLHAANDTTALRLSLEAGARNRGLTPRDSLFVLADSLGAAVSQTRGPPVELLARLAGVLDTLLRFSPDDPEVLYRVTDENFHYNPLGRDERWHLDQFTRAIALDSLFAPGYQHAIELSAMLEPAEATRALITGMLAVVEPNGERSSALRLTLRLLDSTASPAARQSLLDSAPDPVLRRAFLLVKDSPDTLGLMASRTGLQRFPGMLWRRHLAYQLLYRGRLTEADRQFARARASGEPLPGAALTYAGELVSVGRLPQAAFDSLYDDMVRRELGVPPLGAVLWAAARDTVRLAQIVERWGQRYDGSPGERALVRDFVRAMYQLGRGDSSWFRRSRTFLGESVAPGMRAETPFGVFPVEMALAMGREDEAWELLQSRGGGGVVSQVRWMLHRARLAEKRGDREIAVENYGFVARLWADAEEPLRSDAREAREALQRLTGEP